MLDETAFEKKVLLLVTDAASGKARKQAITPDMRLQRDLGIDSIGLLGMIVRFEETFGVDLSHVDLGAYAGKIRTVADALHFGRDIVQKAMAARAQA